MNVPRKLSVIAASGCPGVDLPKKLPGLVQENVAFSAQSGIIAFSGMHPPRRIPFFSLQA
jgi:hypothetical protein